MQVNHKLIKHFLFSIVTAMGLIACGGGSGGSGDETNNSLGDGNVSAGSGGCVTFPRAKVGQIAKREIKDDAGNVTISKKTEIMAISNTSIRQKVMSNLSGIHFDSTIVEHYTIANNYRDITKEENIASGLSTNETIFSPFKRTPIDKVCEGQTWNTTYTEKEGGASAPKNHSQNYTIEAVNVSKTTPLGTFNTFRVKMEETSDNISIVGTTWIDIKTGYDILSEFGDTEGHIQGTLELVKKNF